MWLPHSFIALLLAVLVDGSFTNTTIDDSDSSFTFDGAWNTITPTSPCDICSSKPDPSQTNDGTWHDGNIRNGAPSGTTGSFTFKGSAVYIFGIDQAQSQPNIAFTLGSVQTVHHYAGTEQFVYNALFFSATGLAADQTHTVNWEFDIANTGVQVQAALFDYAIVSSGEEDKIVSPTVSPTVGATALPTSHLSTSSVKTTSHTISSASSRTSQSFISSSGSSIVSSSGSSIVPSGALPSNESLSSPTVTVDGITTVTSTPQSAASRAKSNLAAIVGGSIGALAVAALVALFLFLRSRRVHRIRPETDKAAHSQFLRIEDYPLHSLGSSPDTREIRHPVLSSMPSTSSSKSRAHLGPVSTTSLLPQAPAATHTEHTSPSDPEIEPPAGITQPSRDSGFRVLEERLATLEAQVAVQQHPPPYINED